MKTTSSASKGTIESNGSPDTVASLDWASIFAELDDHGCAVIGPILTAVQCESLTASYDTERHIPQPNRDGATATAAGSINTSLIHFRPWSAR